MIPSTYSLNNMTELGYGNSLPRSTQMQPVKSIEKTYNLLSKVVNDVRTDWEIILPPKRRLEGHLSKVQSFEWGGESFITQIVSCDDLGTIVHWDAAKGRKLTLFELNVTCHCIAFEPLIGRCAAVGATNGQLHLLELNNTGKISKGVNTKPKVNVPAHTAAVYCAKFLGHEHLITGGGDKSICIWDLQSLSGCISRHLQHEGEVYSLSVFEDDANIFVSGSTDGTSKMWDIRVKQPVQATFEGHTAAVNSVEFMPGKMTSFISGADDATVRLWDLRMDTEVAVFGDQRFPGDGVNSVCFSNSGRAIFAGTDNKLMKSWDLLSNTGPFEYYDYGFDCPITQVHLSVDGYSVAVLGQDGVLGIAY